MSPGWYPPSGTYLLPGAQPAAGGGGGCGGPWQLVLHEVWDCPELVPDGSAMDKTDPPPQSRTVPTGEHVVPLQKHVSKRELATTEKIDNEEKEETLEQGRSKEAPERGWREETPEQGQGTETGRCWR